MNKTIILLAVILGLNILSIKCDDKCYGTNNQIFNIMSITDISYYPNDYDGKLFNFFFNWFEWDAKLPIPDENLFIRF